MGLGKVQSYQWFTGNRQEVFILKTEFDIERRPKETMGGVSI